MTENHTERLAEFVAVTGYEDLPTGVVEKAKRVVMDFLGCALSGSLRKPGMIMSDTINEMFVGGPQEATVIGHNSKMSAAVAALANGTFGSACTLYDDGYNLSLGHPSVGSVPAALAMAEKMQLDGKEFLLSVVMGWEVAARVGAAVGAAALYKGWHPRGGANYFGAAAAAGKALKLDKIRMAHALSLAGAQAAGLVETYIPWFAFCFLSGSASHDGILACMLANRGFTGGTTVLEGKNGYVQAVSNDPKLDLLTKDLGKDYQILQTFQKRWTTSTTCHAMVDATIALREKYNIKARDVKRITVKDGQKTTATAQFLSQKMIPEPKNDIQATWSPYYSVAAGLLDGRLTPEQFSEEKLKDPNLRDLMKKITIEMDPELAKLLPKHFPAIVTVETSSGKYTESVKIPKGDPANPLTDQELEDKLTALARPLMSDQRIDDLIKIIYNLDKIKRIDELASTLKR
jgi:2-methylcitrate dehydratase PrpD